MDKSRRIKMGLTLASTIIIPGSGYVILGRPTKGLLMLMWMFVFGYITFHLTSEDISMIGRLSGGFAIWTISVLDVYNLLKKRYRLNKH